MPSEWDVVAEKPTAKDEWTVVSENGQKPPKTAEGFAGNLARSGVKFLSDTASGLKAMHDATPLSTRVEMAASAMPGIGPIVSGARALRGWMNGSTPETIKNVAGGMADRYGQRYGSPQRAVDTLYEDPVGALSDASAVLGGGGALLRGGSTAARVAGLPKMANAAQSAATLANKASLVTNPLTLPTRALPAIPGVQSLLNRGAEKIYEINLKPSTTMPIPEREAIVRMGLSEKIPVTRGGVRKLLGKIGDIDNTAKGKIAEGATRGLTVDPTKVVKETERSMRAFDTGVPETQAPIRSVAQGFTDTHSKSAPFTKIEPVRSISDPAEVVGFKGAGAGKTVEPVPIPLAKAQQNKSNIYRYLRDSYGEQVSAGREAFKDIARGLKNEIYGHFPELKSLGQKEKVMIDLEDVLERAVGREGNKNPVGLTTATLAHTGEPIAVGLSHLIERVPGLTSRIAAAVYKANGTAMKPAQIRQIINAASATERDKQQ